MYMYVFLEQVLRIVSGRGLCDVVCACARACYFVLYNIQCMVGYQ